MKILGLGVPEMIALLPAVIIAVVCCLACQRIAKSKGYSEPLFGAMGFFLGLIGLIIAAVMPNKKKEEASAADGLIKYKQLLDQGVITQEEFDRKKSGLLK